jgi:hypothetical protein
MTRLVFAFLAASGVFTTVVAWLPPSMNAVSTHSPKTSCHIHSKPGSAREFSFSEPCATQCYSHRKSARDGTSKMTMSPSLSKSISSVLATTAFLTVSWWCSTIPIMAAYDSNHWNVNMVAQAKEMASGSGSRVNKDPESLLRYGLPIDNKEVSYGFFFILSFILFMYSSF